MPMPEYPYVPGNVDPETWRRDHDRDKASYAMYPLKEMRLTLNLTKTAMANILECDKKEISRIERGDLTYVPFYLLRVYIEYFGGTLKVDADFPDTAHHLPVGERYAAAFGHISREPGPSSAY